MDVSFRFAVRSDLGAVRTNNEDSALASSHMLVLADGMGGHAAGEVASTVAARVFAEITDDPTADIRTQLTDAGRATRAALEQMSAADPLLDSMGTTLLAVVSRNGTVTVGHIGDSRVYALRGSALYQVTTDHTHVQRLIDTGQLTVEQARTHPYRAMLLRSLDDQSDGPDLDVISVELEPDDRLLLCSDGLSDYLLPEQIGEMLACMDPGDAADALVAAALAVGTRDNVTVIVADVVAEPADDTDTAAGAVADPLHLSPAASAALLQTLPTLEPFIAVEDDAPDLDDAVAENPEPARPARSQAGSATVGSPAQAEPPAPVSPATPVDQPQPNSLLPAGFAAGLMLIVAVALWIIL
ncbi:MAG: PP2C family protein-serine/threonine phosphatase [Beutenbergiaceae bacterium]